MRLRSRLFCGSLLLAALVPLAGASATGIRVIHGFAGGSDGAYPGAALIPGPRGVLYGTTTTGGSDGCFGHRNAGCGTVFSLARDGTLTILHAFQEDGDGLFPTTLVRDAAGDLYGITNEGGDGRNCMPALSGCGTVFKITPDGTETILYSFQGGTDGAGPSGLIIDAAGNLYGTTNVGGQKRKKRGFGTVFKITPDGTETILYAFKGGADGEGPSGNLVLDEAGNLYGATTFSTPGAGTVFKLAPEGAKTILHTFAGATADGGGPEGGVVMDGAGNLYGTTVSGGAFNFGAVFKIDAEGTESILYSFAGGADGSSPEAGVILDGAGNLYGATYLGGTGGCDNGCGTVFMVAPDGTKTLLRSLGRRDGANPVGNLYLDVNGNLWGTTVIRGPNRRGTVFRIHGF